MKKNRQIKFALILMVFFGMSCNTKETDSAVEQPIKVIFETDMGNDIDDALALDMLFKYLDKGKIELLAISNNKNSTYSIPFLDIMTNWYGYPHIPLATVYNGANSEGDSRNYAQITYEHFYDMNLANGKSIEDYNNSSESTELYRKLLAEQPDHSVTIVSVGFSTNIAKLLDTQGDQYSNLSGKELIEKKVKLLSIMAGNFQDDSFAEYNVKVDIPSAKKIFEEWPTPIIASPFEVGQAIEYPATSIQNDFSWAEIHPLVIAYEAYLEMPYDRPTWDLTSVLYAVEGNDKDYFQESDFGRISVNNEGVTEFKKDDSGKHRFLSVNSEQAERIRNHFINLITQMPKNLKK